MVSARHSADPQVPTGPSRATEPGLAHRIRHSPFADDLRRLIARHGWRIYAVPILAVITIVTILQPTRGGHSPQASAAAPGPATASPTTPTTASPTTPTTVSSGSVTPTSSTTAAIPSVDPAYGQLIQVPATRTTTACVGNTASQSVLVSVSLQHAWMCAGNRLVYDTAVTTGASPADRYTPAGSWTVQGKETNRDLVGPGYSEFVKYWVPYNGDFGFHDASWQTMPFGMTGYRTLGSHGCVHLPTPAMTWLFSWIQVGTEVTVQA